MTMTIDARILKALRAAGSNGMPGTEISRQLGVSRAAIWARIEELRTAGYKIIASPHHGYQLISGPEGLVADDLISRLENPRVIGREIRVFRETRSTNEIMEKLAVDNLAEGIVVFAESQTAGRGRLGRRWISPPGKGLWFSILLRPPLRPQEMTRLTIASVTSIARALRNYLGLKPEIKWPNDLLLRGRKVAGILTELNTEPDRIKYAILGIGLNVNLEARDLPDDLHSFATSLLLELGRPLDRAELAVQLLREIDRDYERICTGQFDTVAREWSQQCRTLGNYVSATVGPNQVRGWAESLDTDGALIIRNDHGHLQRIIGGDVFIENA